jgi:hypothetical protein
LPYVHGIPEQTRHRRETVKAAINTTARNLLSVVNAMLATGVDYRAASET